MHKGAHTDACTHAYAHIRAPAGASRWNAMPAHRPVVPPATVACEGSSWRRKGAIVDDVNESVTSPPSPAFVAAGQVLKTNEDYGYVVLDVERRKAYELKRALEAVPSTIWVRIVRPQCRRMRFQWPQPTRAGRSAHDRQRQRQRHFICTGGPKQKTEAAV